MSELSDLLKQHLPDGWSARQVAREARKRGHQMGDATATSYLGGRHGVPSDQVLDAFAEILRIPIDRLRKAAGLVPQVGEPWQPPAASRYLRGDQRQALERLIVTMVEREQGGGEHGTGSPAMNPPSPGNEGPGSAMRSLPKVGQKERRVGQLQGEAARGEQAPDNFDTLD